MRDVATGKETALTTDGVKDFGYATDNAGWTHSDRPIVLWSPDSKKIATFQQDQRGVGEMYLVDTRVGHPNLQAWKYPLPGDDVVTMIQRVVIDAGGETPKVVRLQMPPDQHRSTLCDDVACRGGEWADVQWSPDATHLAFVSTSRDHRREQLRVADASTGAIRDVLEETVPTFFESGNGAVNWRYLPASNEILWFSERDNWGQLYLYDLQTGRLKNQVTTGEGNVTQLLKVDEKARTLYFLGVGREKGRDPYFTHFYRIGFDGKNLQLLTPEDATHDVALSPSGEFFVDSYSKPDVPPVAVLRDARGRDRDAREGRHLEAARDRLEAADAHHREGARRPDRSLRPDVQADESRSVEEVSDRQPHLSRAADRQRRRPHVLARARRLRRRSPSSASSSSRSTGWGRRGDRRSSTRRTTATWATTRCPIRWRA